MTYLSYNKQELVDKINKISIFMNEVGQVITKYGDSVTSISNVSKRYEIFDIQKYLIDKIDAIEKNFKIHQYGLKIKGGVQSLILISDSINIEGIDFHKSFFILIYLFYSKWIQWIKKIFIILKSEFDQKTFNIQLKNEKIDSDSEMIKIIYKHISLKKFII